VDGSFVALDAHMDMENEARPRQKPLLHELGVGDEETRQAREATAFELAGEEVDAQDHRGGLAKLVLQKPGVDKIAVMMSIVSNTRVDIVARGVIKACLELGYDPAEKIAIFRIPGAWEEEGFKILEKYGVDYADRSVSLHEAARRAVEKIG
jgi:succinyl-CoA synthetase beta subunit/citryl-CoA synthetase large subunit